MSFKRNEPETRNRIHKWWLGHYKNQIQKPGTDELKSSKLASMNLNPQTKIQKLKYLIDPVNQIKIKPVKMAIWLCFLVVHIFGYFGNGGCFWYGDGG